MPVRDFRVIIRNRSQSLVLSRTFDHLCDGAYTDGGWRPTDVICFPDRQGRDTGLVCSDVNGEGALQSESNWPLGGTEGYIKYDVLEVSPTLVTPTRVGMVYVYWNNPFYGVTHCRFASSSTDVAPDCDFSGPGQGSSFANDTKSPLPFSFIPSWGVANTPDHGMYPVWGTQDQNPEPADFAAAYAAFAAGAVVGVGVGGLVAGVGDLLATTGIVDHAWIQIDLKEADPNAMGSLAGQSAQNPSYSQDKTVSAQQWGGHWIGDKVDVTISTPALATTLHAPSISIAVHDLTAAAPISFTVTVNLAAQLVRPAASRLYGAAMPAHLSSVAHADIAARANIVVRLRGMELPRDVNGVVYIDGVIYLPDGITLRLYNQYQGATLSGVRLLYQRVGTGGKVATHQMLVRPIKIG